VTAANTPWRTRIVGHGEESPDQLLANPYNWRVHPLAQQEKMSEVLDRVGWVQDVIVNRTTGHVIDGHLRVALSISREEPSVPVVYVELTEDEELLVLATYDPLSSLAVPDAAILAQIRELTEVGPSLDEMIAGILPAELTDVDPGQQDPPQLPSEVLVEIRCRRTDLDELQETLEAWQLREGVDVQITS
jgi:hypothetical protein